MPFVSISNSGFQSFAVSRPDQPSKFVYVKPFRPQRVEISAAQPILFLHFPSGRSVHVRFDAKTGAVVSPAMVTKSSNGLMFKSGAQNAVRSSAPWSLKVWPMLFGIPWFCIAGTLGVIAIALVVALVVHLSALSKRRRGGGGGGGARSRTTSRAKRTTLRPRSRRR